MLVFVKPETVIGWHQKGYRLFLENQMPERKARTTQDFNLGTFQHRAKVMNIKQIVTARKAPKMNAICERVIGTFRRECLNHCIILNERHLYRILTEYINEYYHKSRTHQGLDNDCPEPRAIDRPENGPVISTPILGGLHHRYTRKAAS